MWVPGWDTDEILGFSADALKTSSPRPTIRIRGPSVDEPTDYAFDRSGNYGWQIKGPGRSSRFQRFRSDTVVNQGLASCFAYPASVLTHPRRSPSIIPADFGSAATTLMSWLPSAPASSGPERHVRRSESDFLRVRAHRADRRQSRTTLGRGGVTGHRRRDRCGSPRPQASIPHHADGGLDPHATHRFDVEGNSWLPCYNGTVARFDRSRLRPGTVDEPDLVLA